jgi:hypothetical protein
MITPTVLDGWGKVPIAATADRRRSLVGRCQIEQDLHGGGLACAVRTEEPGDTSRFDGEREIVEDRVVPVALGQMVDRDGVTVQGVSSSFVGPVRASTVSTM